MPGRGELYRLVNMRKQEEHFIERIDTPEREKNSIELVDTPELSANAFSIAEMVSTLEKQWEQQWRML